MQREKTFQAMEGRSLANCEQLLLYTVPYQCGPTVQAWHSVHFAP